MRNRVKLAVFFSGLLIAIFCNLFYPVVANADPPSASSDIVRTPQEIATRWMYYRGLSYCILNVSYPINGSTISLDDVDAGQFWESKLFDKNPAIGYYFLTPDNETYSCGSAGWVKNAFINLGFKDMRAAAISLGFEEQERTDGVHVYVNTVIDGDHLYSIDKFRIYASTYGNPEDEFDAAAQYVQELRAFSAGCLEKSDLGYLKTDALTEDEQNRLEDKYKYTIKYYDKDQGIVSGVYKGKAHSTNVKYRVNITGNTADNGVAECYNDGGGWLGSLVDSVNGRVEDYQKIVEALIAAGSMSAEDSDTANMSSVTQTSSNSCVIDGVGWIICPVMKFLGSITDGAFGVISELLSVKPDLVASGDSSGTYVAWQYFRNISNVLFVIAFLIIIFSQLTGAGVTNYGVKKILPRLVITAILVNVSFYICQIAVDISEILGHSLNSFIGETIPSQLNIKANILWTDNLGGILGGVGLVAIGAITGTAALVAAYLSISVPVLLAALLSVVVTLAILVGRQAAIVILIVICPIAFVAYLLPNTEQWFKKWGKIFVGLLMVYPAISLLYGAGKLAGLIIHNADPNNLLFNIVALGATAIPLIATPSLLKSSMNATGAIGAKLSGWASKANGAVGARVKDSSMLGTTWSDAMAHRSNQRQIRFANRRTRDTRLNRALNRLGGEGYAERVARRGSKLEEQEFEQSVADSVSAQKMMVQDGASTGTDGLMQIATGKSLTGATYSEADRVAAIRTIMKNGNAEQRRAIYQSAATASDEARASISEGYFARGDHKVYGADLGDKIKKLANQEDLNLDNSMDKQIMNGKFSPEVLASDVDIADHIYQHASQLSQEARDSIAETASRTLNSQAADSITQAHLEGLKKLAGISSGSAARGVDGFNDRHGNPY